MSHHTMLGRRRLFHETIQVPNESANVVSAADG